MLHTKRIYSYDNTLPASYSSYVCAERIGYALLDLYKESWENLKVSEFLLESIKVFFFEKKVSPPFQSTNPVQSSNCTPPR